MTSRRIFATRSDLGLSNLILDKLLYTSENKQHLRVIDDRDTQDMRERERERESKERYLDDLHGVGSGVGAVAASMEEAAHSSLRLRTPTLSS